MLWRWPGALCCALASGTLLALSASGPVQLAPNADCQARADVLWSFTYTTPPAREFGLVTNASGAQIGGFDKASTLSGGSFSARWDMPITVPQPTNALIGSYGRAGDNPPTATETAEFFVLYNCTTRQVLFSCSGSYGTCPTNVPAAVDRITQPIPVLAPGALVALIAALAAFAGAAIRRCAPARRVQSVDRP